MKTEVSTIDATPSKRLYHSIIADYGLVTAISELVDNVIDSKRRHQSKTIARVKIDLDLEDQSIVVTDNTGGVSEADLKKLISPGASHSDGQGQSIGIFGVGSKRAAVALAREIKIATRCGRSKDCYLLEYDDSWQETESWFLPCYKMDNSKLPASSTQITLSRLRSQLMPKDVVDLKSRLSETFAKFIGKGELVIQMGDETLMPSEFSNWAFPPECPPMSFPRTFVPDNRRLPVRVTITSGITLNRGASASAYGVFVYCNERLIVRASKDVEYGFLTGVAGVPHPSMANSRVVIEIVGGASDMPWNSSKTGINFNHAVFRAIQTDVHTAVKHSTAVSKKLWEHFDEKIAPYKTGNILVAPLKADAHLTLSKLPPIPTAQKNRSETIVEVNKGLAVEKPWIVGAYESLQVAEMLAGKKTLQQRNRIALIVLDSALEIAFKDFLAHEAKQPLGEQKLLDLFKDRESVHKEIEKTVLNGSQVWQRVRYYYKLRCELVHKRASVSVSDADIANFRSVVEKLLSQLFGINFPSGRIG